MARKKRSYTRRRQSPAKRRPYRRRRSNPKGLKGLKLNQAIMTFLGVLAVYQLPNFAIKFFNMMKSTVTQTVGTETQTFYDKSQYLKWQVIGIVAVYFFADTLGLKNENKSAIINGMIAGLGMQFADQFLFKNKNQFYGYLRQAPRVPISRQQTSGYLSQRRQMSGIPNNDISNKIKHMSMLDAA